MVTVPGETIPIGVTVTYSRQYRRCGKLGCAKCAGGVLGHGPYWYAYWNVEGKRHSRYLGRNAPPGVAEETEVRQAETEDPAVVDSVKAAQAQQAPRAAPDALPALRVRTLGGFAVWRLGLLVPDAQWYTRQAGALLKCLVSAPGQRLAREQVIAWLWPELNKEAGQGNLRQALHQARRALTPPGAGDGNGSCLWQEGDVLILAPERPAGQTSAGVEAATWLDAKAFDLAATHALAGRDVAACRTALDLYGGEYLPDDHGENWAEGPRERLKQQHHRLLLHLAELKGTHGELAEAEEHLRTLLAENSLDELQEQAAARLMTMLAGQGRWTEALRVYQALAQALDEELGVEPGEDLQGLRSRLLAETTLSRPAARPPRRPRPDRPTNLPTSLTSFVGRAWEQEEVIRALLGTPGNEVAPCRLLTLSGVGGVGKTRLALEVGASLVERYPDGVWLVELAATAASVADDATPVAQAVAVALGVQEEKSRPLLATLTEFLRSRQLLLVLDNCEHLMAACAIFAATLLRNCADLSILATSRAALGVEGETVWVVPTLAVPPQAEVAVDRLGCYEAVQLFLARGRAARTDLTLTDRNAANVAWICRKLDGIPLAIELAAARLGMFGIEEVAARLGDTFRLLTGGSRTVLPRQQTLRASLEWSHGLLNEAERVVLRRLSVFAAGCTLAAAELVCSGEPVPGVAVVSHLGQLVRHSLVLLQPDEDPTRYRLLEPVRQYEQEQLELSGEAEALRKRHAMYFLALAREAEPHLLGAEQTSWLARLETEHDNLRTALRWAQESGPHYELGLQLAGALRRFWEYRGYLSEGRSWLEGMSSLGNARGRVESAESRAMQATVLSGAGALAGAQGDLERAEALHKEALTLRRELGDTPGIAGSLGNLGLMAMVRGDYARATALYMECLPLFREVSDKRGIAASLNNMGLVAHAQGDNARATALLAESVALWRDVGEKENLAFALDHLGLVAFRQGDYTRATALYMESAPLFREVGDKRGVAWNRLRLAYVVQAQGDCAQATMLYKESIVLCWELGDRLCIAYSLEGLARVATAPDTTLLVREQAARLDGAATALRRVIGAPLAPNERADYDNTVADLRAVLGEAAFEAAWAEGEAMSVEQAVAAALAEPHPA